MTWMVTAGQMEPLRRVASAAMTPTTKAAGRMMLSPWKAAKTAGQEREREDQRQHAAAGRVVVHALRVGVEAGQVRDGGDDHALEDQGDDPPGRSNANSA